MAIKTCEKHSTQIFDDLKKHHLADRMVADEGAFLEKARVLIDGWQKGKSHTAENFDARVFLVGVLVASHQDLLEKLARGDRNQYTRLVVQSHGKCPICFMEKAGIQDPITLAIDVTFAKAQELGLIKAS